MCFPPVSPPKIHYCYGDKDIALFIPPISTFFDIELVMFILKYPRKDVEKSKLTQAHTVAGCGQKLARKGAEKKKKNRGKKNEKNTSAPRMRVFEPQTPCGAIAQ